MIEHTDKDFIENNKNYRESYIEEHGIDPYDESNNQESDNED
jgi:hypothetical protein